MNTERRNVTEYLLEDETDYNDMSFKEFLFHMNSIFNDIPEEYKENTWFEIDAEEYYGSCSAGISIYYSRPETDEEYEKRINKEKDKIRRNDLEERVLYERLREKYGNDSGLERKGGKITIKD